MARAAIRDPHAMTSMVRRSCGRNPPLRPARRRMNAARRGRVGDGAAMMTRPCRMMRVHSMDAPSAPSVAARRRREIGPDGRRRRRFVVFQIGENLIFVLMHIERGEKFRVIVAGGESEMRSVVLAHDFIVIAAEFR